MIATTPPEPALSIVQRARAEALREARTVLAARGPLSTGPVDCIDLVAVAGWILDGEDPWPSGADGTDIVATTQDAVIEETIS